MSLGLVAIPPPAKAPVDAHSSQIVVHMSSSDHRVLAISRALLGEEVTRDEASARAKVKSGTQGLGVPPTIRGFTGNAADTSAILAARVANTGKSAEVDPGMSKHDEFHDGEVSPADCFT